MKENTNLRNLEHYFIKIKRGKIKGQNNWAKKKLPPRPNTILAVSGGLSAALPPLSCSPRECGIRPLYIGLRAIAVAQGNQCAAHQQNVSAGFSPSYTMPLHHVNLEMGTIAIVLVAAYASNVIM